MKTKITLATVLVLFMGLTLRFVISPDQDFSQEAKSKHRGVCWVGEREIVTEKEFEALILNNINWISQTPFAWQKDANNPAIRMNKESSHVWWGESDEGIAETARLAKRCNIKTLLKPHLWVSNSWPGEVEMLSEKDWSLWFSNYKDFIIHYAKLAEVNQMEILCIGTELSRTTAREKEWRSLINEIRKVFSGKLTYGANFHNEFEQIKFWDALDFIGIQAYFSLTQKNNASTQELITSWTSHLRGIEQVQAKYNKPVLFTEIGYRSTADAAIEPWKWPQENSDAVSSQEMQSKCYEAFFKSAWSRPWLAGAYFWKWYPHGGHRLNEIDFTPQGKQAEKILLENFSSSND